MTSMLRPLQGTITGLLDALRQLDEGGLGSRASRSSHGDPGYLSLDSEA
jgi:hypothetical protein